ncbi:membrane protein insertase YidC [Fructobacillus cardui]|uniref:membrane protein insertase YidC n=1 Tax=Fructobacillus cardui TaxID=2893170 RepID=UPI00200B9436|nr:membrane protein insertase YidC [Fructobacillus cardui]MCK8627680.1 membrane protein insertase YidC [Fructobacillus cardui]
MKSAKRTFTILFVLLDIYLMTGGYGVHGRMYRFVSTPIAHILTEIAKWVGGVNAIGWAIIILTAIIRLILLPIFVNQQINTTKSSLKMEKLRPELEKVQAAVKGAKTAEEQQAASMASMSLYRENGVSMTGGISWLTMAIQLPIFSGLYLAIQHADGLKTATFFGLPLSKPEILLSLVVFVIYAAQAYLSLIHMPAEQKKTAGQMLWISPVMIAGITLISSGALGLYFIVGGITVVLQAFIVHLMYAKLEDDVDKNFVLKKGADDLLSQPASAAFGRNQNRVRPEDLRPRDVTDDDKSQQSGPRNAGKQQRRNEK